MSVGATGLACGAAAALLTVPVTLSAPAPAGGGVGGGAPITIEGSGFASPAQGGLNSGTFCGRPAKVLSAEPTRLVVAAPRLSTAAALDRLRTSEEAALGGVAALAPAPLSDAGAKQP